MIKKVIVVLSCSSAKRIQTIIPSVLNGKPLYLGYDCKAGKLFLSGTKLNIEERFPGQAGKKCCQCGIGRKSEKNSCTSQRCPCFRIRSGCSGCACKNCHNPFGKESPLVATKKEKACRCGHGSNANPENNCEKTRCPCFLGGFSCNILPKCRCKTCNNPNGQHVEVYPLMTPPSGSKRGSLDSSGKLGRVTSKKLCLEMGMKEKQLMWTPSETLFLTVCTSLCQEKNMKELTGFYNAASDKMKPNDIRKKSVHQVFCKVKNMDSYSEIFSK